MLSLYDLDNLTIERNFNNSIYMKLKSNLTLLTCYFSIETQLDFLHYILYHLTQEEE